MHFCSKYICPKNYFGLRFTKLRKLPKVGRKTAKKQTNQKFKFHKENLNSFGKI